MVPQASRAVTRAPPRRDLEEEAGFTSCCKVSRIAYVLVLKVDLTRDSPFTFHPPTPTPPASDLKMRYLYFGNPISFVYFLLSVQVLLNMLTGLWHTERKQGERICFTNSLGFCPSVPGTGVAACIQVRKF